MEIHYHGHSLLRAERGRGEPPRRPVPEAEQPERRGHRRRGQPDPHRDHPRPRRSHRRRGPGREADRRPLRRHRRARQLARLEGRRGTSQTPTSAARSSFDWGYINLVPAWHTNTLPGSDEAPFSAEHGIAIGTPAGFLIKIGGLTVYHAGDTCLFSDMKLIAERNPIDIALLPIGGHYTMDRHDAVVAAEFVGAGDGDPDALQHLPADRDRRRGLQVRGRVEDLLQGRRPRPGGESTRTGSTATPHQTAADLGIPAFDRRWILANRVLTEDSVPVLNVGHQYHSACRLSRPDSRATENRPS